MSWSELAGCARVLLAVCVFGLLTGAVADGAFARQRDMAWKAAQHCPRGMFGKPPRCVRVGHNTKDHLADPHRHCPPGMIGKPPRCQPIRTGYRPPHLHRDARLIAANKHLRPGVIIGTVPGELELNTPPSPKAQAIMTPREPQRQPLAIANAEVPRFRPAELVVMVRGAEPGSTAARLTQTFNLTMRETVTLGLLPEVRVYRLAIPDNRSVEGLAAALSNTPNVTATPNYYHHLQGEAAPRQGPAHDAQYALPKLHVPAAQAIATGRGTTIAVIDSGVDAHHPALAHTNLTLLDVVEDGVKAPDRHGTAVTGIIAAQGDVTGIAPDARIIAVRAFASEREGTPPVTTSLRLARAVDAAFEKGARIFNMSFAGPRDALLIEMIDAAYARGATFVAAAGNDGPDGPPAFPAAYEKVIAITATDEADRLYPQANRGRYVAAAAPGVDILAPVTGDGFDYLSGTSFAAAHITGIVALLQERNPNLTGEEARRIITGTAHALGGKGQTQDFGAGLADAYASLQDMQARQQQRVQAK